MDNSQLKQFLLDFLGNNSYILLTAIFLAIFKTSISNLAQGFMFWLSREFNEDDIVYIKGRKARIMKIGFRSTSFYIFDKKTKVYINNERLKYLFLEKIIPIGETINENKFSESERKTSSE